MAKRCPPTALKCLDLQLHHLRFERVFLATTALARKKTVSVALSLFGRLLGTAVGSRSWWGTGAPRCCSGTCLSGRQ